MVAIAVENYLREWGASMVYPTQHVVSIEFIESIASIQDVVRVFCVRLNGIFREGWGCWISVRLFCWGIRRQLFSLP